MSKLFARTVIVLFVVLSALTTYVLWLQFEWRVGVQVLVILLVAGIGEHHVSGRGYYHYTSVNGIFIGRVPVWIPFMWVAVCHATHILPLLAGLSSAPMMLTAGMIGLVGDLIFIEPVFSRMKGLWLWTPVQRGYFGFVPNYLNRFTAPIGNYLVWFGFPLFMSWLLDGLIVLF